MSDAIIQFIPVTILGLIWVWPVAIIARKQGILDRLNALQASLDDTGARRAA